MPARRSGSADVLQIVWSTFLLLYALVLHSLSSASNCSGFSALSVLPPQGHFPTRLFVSLFDM